MNSLSYREFIDAFPAFGSLPERTVQDIISGAALKAFPTGMLIYTEGDACSAIAFLLSGEIRVFKTAEGGREITLYEIGRGETCILNASCILADTPYPANAVSLKSGSMLLVSADTFRKLMDLSQEMRYFVFDIMSRRLATVMALVEEVAFGRMDVRLKDYLSDKADNRVIMTTHQRIADDLGTSREVVSRLLKDLERKGILTLSRNEITLIKC